MNLFDQAVLLATGLVALYAIWVLLGQQKDAATKHIANYYYMVSFAVLFVSGVLLIFLGWEILGLLGQ
jgi:cytochrome bd-type quinol oxidase subunit 2